MIPVSMWFMMILWLKQSDTCVNGGLLNDDTLIKESDICIKSDSGLLNDDILIKTNVVVYWLMIFWLKQSDTCVNGGLLNDDILIKTKWYMCQWWFIEWWYFD